MELMELCTGMEESVPQWVTARAQGSRVGTQEGPQGTKEGPQGTREAAQGTLRPSTTPLTSLIRRTTK